MFRPAVKVFRRIDRIALVALLLGSRCALVSAQSSGSLPIVTQPIISQSQPLSATSINVQPLTAQPLTAQPLTTSGPTQSSTAQSKKAQADVAQSLISEPAAMPVISGGNPNSARSRPTGLLRLLSATQPIPDPQLEENAGPSLTPDDPSNPPKGGPSDGAPLEWVNPHEFGPAVTPEKPIWTRWMPNGMDPWGPRTPLADRATGPGRPLTTTSWLNRPFSVGWLAGGVIGPPLMHGVSQNGSFFGGYRFGWDYDYHWGLEARLAGAEIGLDEPRLRHQVLTAGYLLLDANLLYYPWGDSAWRPYASFGLGIDGINFYDARGHNYNVAMLGMPIGVGLKYYWTPWFVFRGDITDNLGFGSSVNVVSNFSFTGGIEWRFGGPRRSYWPWNHGRSIW